MIRLFTCINHIASNIRAIVENLKDALVTYFKELLQQFSTEPEYEASMVDFSFVFKLNLRFSWRWLLLLYGT
jgi:hypothetical protein